MASHIKGSALALDDAIGSYRAALADLLGCTVDTIELWCTPPPDFTPAGAHNRGRRNPLDEVHAIATRCPDGLGAVRFLAQALGYRLVADAATPHDGQLLADPTLLAAAVDRLCRELARRRPTMSPDQVDDLADAAIELIHSLLLAYRERRSTRA